MITLLSEAGGFPDKIWTGSLVTLFIDDLFLTLSVEYTLLINQLAPVKEVVKTSSCIHHLTA